MLLIILYDLVLSILLFNARMYHLVGYKTRGPLYGVDPDFGKKVEVDMSEERMQKAWEAYKIRWENEADDIRFLEEKKLVIIF